MSAPLPKSRPREGIRPGILLPDETGGRLDAIQVIDLFAGPGGLGEGFASLRSTAGMPIFDLRASFECDPWAHRTLRLRAFVRQFLDEKLPQEYLAYIRDPSDERLKCLADAHPVQWAEAEAEAHLIELTIGERDGIEYAAGRLANQSVCPRPPLVIVGGPPCQAYSLVGRARRREEKSDKTLKQETLYLSYLEFINEFNPDLFVMENVKGMLSAQVDRGGIFELISHDMRNLGYRLCSLVSPDPKNPRDYIVRAEDYGMPQARHRVFLVGVRADSGRRLRQLQKRASITVKDALHGIPAIRSGFTQRPEEDNAKIWQDFIRSTAKEFAAIEELDELRTEFAHIAGATLPFRREANEIFSVKDIPYAKWYRGALEGERLLTNHYARAHMESDLRRYLFAATSTGKFGRSPKLTEYPKALLPNHKNVAELKAGQEPVFSDRFRVQVADAPSTTITSHISKDGHYYIHPDPLQCRSLTVREAARLQTFPDDYFFEGPRTAQYQQVGNAVPPLLAQQIAQVVANYFGIESSTGVDGIKG